MENLDWWRTLDADAKQWLIAHNGEAVPGEILAKIVAAGGAVSSAAWWVGEHGPDGFHLSDEAVDWIESAANEESP
ncbi:MULTISPECIES: hypothetical protein [Microbacterium]|uniref:hypothetical protein n=1 Tax=Microbacterium TaxID=33882 RepID=UPI000D65445C|nr:MULTISPECIES: hypothetical protein [Microbacterium]